MEILKRILSFIPCISLKEGKATANQGAPFEILSFSLVLCIFTYSRSQYICSKNGCSLVSLTLFVRHKTPTTEETTEKLSSYKDKIPQLTAQQHKSYLKDTTDFINLKAKKASKRSDNRFNRHYAVTHKYTPTPPPKKKKIAGAFASVLMAKIGMQIPERGAYKPLVWKRYIRDIISLLHTNKYIVNQFIEQATKHHSTIKFTAETCFRS